MTYTRDVRLGATVPWTTGSSEMGPLAQRIAEVRSEIGALGDFSHERPVATLWGVRATATGDELSVQMIPHATPHLRAAVEEELQKRFPGASIVFAEQQTGAERGLLGRPNQTPVEIPRAVFNGRPDGFNSVPASPSNPIWTRGQRG